jgi:hypothetical protein
VPRRFPFPIAALGSKAVETLLREGLGRVGEAELVEPRLPTTVEEVKNLSWDELTLVIALTHAPAIRAVLDNGDEALHSVIRTWTTDERETLARALAEVSSDCDGI